MTIGDGTPCVEVAPAMRRMTTVVAAQITDSAAKGEVIRLGAESAPPRLRTRHRMAWGVKPSGRYAGTKNQRVI